MTQPDTVQISPQALVLAQEADKAETVLLYLHGLTIQGPEQRDTVQQTMVWVKRLGKDLDAQRTSATKPLNAVLKTVNGWFKPRIDICERVEAACKDALWRHDRALAAEQQKQLQAAATAFQAGQTEQATQALAAIPDIPQVAGTSIGTRLVLRVVAPDMVPREYCSPDPGKLAQVPKGQPVAGCVWEEQANVRVRT